MACLNEHIKTFRLKEECSGSRAAYRRKFRGISGCFGKFVAWAAVLVIFAVMPAAAASEGFTQTTDGNQTDFYQTAQKVYNEVEAYDIGEDEVHIYHQPSSAAVFLQQVIGGDISEISGKLSANGQVWILNPSGVLFGAGSVINTAGFMAAAATMERGDFFSGDYAMARGGEGGFVVNNGSIHIQPGGYAVLAGQAVANSGLVVADQGQIVMASGDRMTFDFFGDGLIHFGVDDKTASMIMGPEGRPMNDAVYNSGELSAAKVLLTAGAAKDIFESVVNNEGIIEAESAVGGAVIQLLGDGAVVNSGELYAAGKASRMEIKSDDGVVINGVVVLGDDGQVSITADADNDGAGDLFAGRQSSALIKTESGSIQLAGNDVRLDDVTLVTTDGGDVKILAVGGYSSSINTVFEVTGSLFIDPEDPADHSTTQGSAAIDWTTVSDSNVNFNPGADVQGKTITVESDVDTGFGAPGAVYPNYGDIVFDNGEITGNDMVTLDANLGNILMDGGLITSLGNADFTAQLIGTMPVPNTVVYHSDPAYPVTTPTPLDPAAPDYQETTITAGTVHVDINGTLTLNAQSMSSGISGVLDGSAGQLNINPTTPGMIIWNGIYIDHAGPMAVAYAQAISTSSPYEVNELGGVEDLRRGSEYYGGGVPYEGFVMDNRARFDVLGAGVFVPYPDLILDLRLMKPCEDK